MSDIDPEASAPVRACCGQRHSGALCPDGQVMCCLCFNRYPLSAMSETDGTKTDLCPNCALAEQLQAKNRDLAAALVEARARIAELESRPT